MGRPTTRKKEGFIQCPICEKGFELKDPQFKFIFSHYKNEDLHDAIKDFIIEKPHNIDIISKEPFYKHLNRFQHCPISRCHLCHDKDSISLKLFTSRHQHYFHKKQKHEVKEQMKGRTGFNDRIRKEVLRQTQRHINKMSEMQVNYNLSYPTTIEVIITGYQGTNKVDIQKQTNEEKKKKKEEQYAKIKHSKTVKKNMKILKETTQLLEEHGIKMDIQPKKEEIPIAAIEDNLPAAIEDNLPAAIEDNLPAAIEEIPLDDLEDDLPVCEFYKLEKKHLEPLGIYRPKKEWEKLNEFIDELEDNDGYYFVYFDDSLYLVEVPFKDVEKDDLEDPIYTLSENRETFESNLECELY